MDTLQQIIEAAGHAIRMERHRRGWALKELAGRAGLTMDWLSKTETATRMPTLKTYYRICGVLGWSLAWLFSPDRMTEWREAKELGA